MRRRYSQFLETITMMLLERKPTFLMLPERWVDALLEAEQDICNKNDVSCISYLFEGESLENFDFTCQRFRALLEKQCNYVYSRRRNVLMNMCQKHP